MAKKLIIGVTGTFGSGKSTVAMILKNIFDADIVDADRIAKHIFATKTKAEIKRIFKTTDKKILAEAVFSNKRLLKILNNIIHPHVRDEISNAINNSKKPFVIVVSPLLVEEMNIIKKLDVIIIVKCRKDIQYKRLEYKGYSREQTLKRMRHQFAFSKKVAAVRKLGLLLFTVNNSGPIEETERQLIKLCGVLNG